MEGDGEMKRVILALTAFLMLNYVAIDLAHVLGVISRFPLFLFFENVFWFIAYAISLYCVLKKGRVGYLVLSAVAWFNAGRVSRSVVTPYGEVPKLWAPHLFLELLILAVAILSSVQLKSALNKT